MKSGFDIYKKLNWVLIISYLLLVFFGWINIYASTYSEETSSIFSLSTRSGGQLMWIGVSIIAGILILFVFSPKIYSAFAWPFYILVTLLLVAVLIFGKEINGAKSWLSFGGFAIQPSEFSKITTLLCLATIMSKYNYKLMSFKGFLSTAAVILLPVGLIALEPDIGTVLVYCGLVFLLYREGLPSWVLLYTGIVILLFLTTLKYSPFVSILISLGLAGLVTSLSSRKSRLQILYYILFIAAAAFIPKLMSIKAIAESAVGKIEPEYILLIILIPFIVLYIINGAKKKLKYYKPILLGFAISVVFIFSVELIFENVLKPHHRDRIENLLGISDDIYGAGYNVNQSMIAIGSGGFAGKGFLQGTQTKFNFVPEQSTDFIFCTIGEEWGFLGSLALILIFFIMIATILTTAEKNENKFTRVFGYGLACYLFMHCFVNIGMTIGIMPVVGIPLPFISYGGSSLLTFSILLFIYIRLDLEKWR